MYHPTDEIQRKLQERARAAGKPDPLPKYGADGKGGQETLDAMTAYMKEHGLTVSANVTDEFTDSLFGEITPAHTAPAKPAFQFPFPLPNIGGVTIADWAANWATSKINQVAIGMAAAVVLVLNNWLMVIGVQLDSSAQKVIAGLIVVVGTLAINVLRTFFNKPKVAVTMPEKVVKT